MGRLAIVAAKLVVIAGAGYALIGVSHLNQQDVPDGGAKRAEAETKPQSRGRSASPGVEQRRAMDAACSSRTWPCATAPVHTVMRENVADVVRTTAASDMAEHLVSDSSPTGTVSRSGRVKPRETTRMAAAAQLKARIPLRSRTQVHARRRHPVRGRQDHYASAAIRHGWHIFRGGARSMLGETNAGTEGKPDKLIFRKIGAPSREDKQRWPMRLLRAQGPATGNLHQERKMSELVSRRRLLAFLGLAAPGGAMPALLAVPAEAQTVTITPATGTERRVDRRIARTERRQDRRISRVERRRTRREGRMERRSVRQEGREIRRETRQGM